MPAIYRGVLHVKLAVLVAYALIILGLRWIVRRMKR